MGKGICQDSSEGVKGRVGRVPVPRCLVRSTHTLLLSLGIPRTYMWSAWDANAVVVTAAAVPDVHPVLLVLVRVRGDLGVQDLAL
jgi:hypothetical protein